MAIATRQGVRSAAVHLISDLDAAERLDDIDHVEATLAVMLKQRTRRGAHIHLHRFQPNGSRQTRAATDRLALVVRLADEIAAHHANVFWWAEVCISSLAKMLYKRRR